MNPYAGAVRRLGRHRAVAWVLSRALPAVDVLFVRRRRSLTSLGTGFPLCYLTTTGRRTGEARTVPLLHVADGERVVLIASNWGRRQHPAWALNLDANPESRVTIEGLDRAYTARRATPKERSRYWAEAVRFWPGYDSYRSRAGREIRVYVLEPAAREECEARAPEVDLIATHCWSRPQPPPTHGNTETSRANVTGPCQVRASFLSIPPSVARSEGWLPPACGGRAARGGPAD